MTNLFNNRLSKYHKKIAKYLKLAFNDHFIIALLFIFGACVYGYHIFLKNIPVNQLWEKLLFSIVAIIFLQFSNLVTLFQKADIVFLVSSFETVNKCFKKAIHYSLLSSSIIQLFLVFILIPFYLKITQLPIITIYYLIFIQLFGKFTLIQAQSGVAFSKYKSISIFNVILFLNYFLFINRYIYLSIFVVIVTFLITFGYLFINLNKKVIIMHNLINLEQKRILNNYRFLNLFTDVKELNSSLIIKRSIFNGLIKFLSTKITNPYEYLYLRGFLRDKNFFGNIYRLVILGILISIFINNWIYSFVIYLICLFMIYIQLLPLYKKYDYNKVFNLYPLSVTYRINGYLMNIKYLIISITLVFSLESIFIFKNVYVLLLLIIIDLIIYFHCNYILKGYSKKNESKK